MKTVFSYADGYITMKQSEAGEKLFTITYGKQVNIGLTYKQAAEDLGYVIMHHLACESILDNDRA